MKKIIFGSLILLSAAFLLGSFVSAKTERVQTYKYLDRSDSPEALNNRSSLRNNVTDFFSRLKPTRDCKCDDPNCNDSENQPNSEKPSGSSFINPCLLIRDPQKRQICYKEEKRCSLAGGCYYPSSGKCVPNCRY